MQPGHFQGNSYVIVSALQACILLATKYTYSFGKVHCTDYAYMGFVALCSVTENLSVDQSVRSKERTSSFFWFITSLILLHQYDWNT
jgi:hypothetical protein